VALRKFLVNDQRDAKIPFYVFIFLFITLCMFRAHRAHHQERLILSIQFVSPDDEHDVLETCREL